MPADETLNDADVVPLFLCCPIPSICRITIHPVFTPNAHLYLQDKSGKPKWEIFADSVRAMMLRETGLKADEGHWQDHIHYYKYLAGKVDHYLVAQKKQE